MSLMSWLGNLRADVRAAMRQLLRARALATIAVITLALGIGANTAVFSIVQAVLLDALPFSDADRLTAVTGFENGTDTHMGPGEFGELARRNRTFESLSAEAFTSFAIAGAAAVERIGGSYVTPSYFNTHRLPPVAGRYFLPEEAQPGQHRVVVLGHALHQRLFGGDPRVIGRVLQLNDESYTVVGVAPAEYALTPNTGQLWVPLVLTSAHYNDFDSQWLRVRGKRRAGVDIDEAQQDLARVMRDLEQSHPAGMTGRSVRIYEFRSHLVDAVDRQLAVLFGAVGVVLLLACINVANLLLARALTRRKEIAIRSALGATRVHIVRQFLTEGLLLAALGGAVSVVVARLAVRVLVEAAPGEIPRLQNVHVGSEALLFLAALTILCGVSLGLLLAFRASRGNLQLTLRAGGRGSELGSTRDPLRQALVVAQLALALLLLYGAGLFVRSGIRLQQIDPGFEGGDALTVRVALSGVRYADPAAIANGYDRLTSALAAVTGIASVAATSQLPLEGEGVSVAVRMEGRNVEPGREPEVLLRSVTPGYFESMRIAIRRGRGMAAQDRGNTARVAVINETFARTLFPNQNALGKRVACCAENDETTWREVVGVVADVRSSLTVPPRAELYLPVAQSPATVWMYLGNSLALVVQPVTGSTPSVQLVRTAIAAVDPSVPLFAVQSLREITVRATAANRFNIVLLSAFGVLAAVLAAVGIYGVLAHFVAQRMHEMGVRIALGAQPRDVVMLVVRQAATLAGVGIVMGITIALPASESVAALLYGITPTDVGTYATVSVGLAIVALLAAFLPARRAATVDAAALLRG